MADGDITIVMTIHPVKSGRRPISIAAAAEGDLPTLLSGAFPDRHALADQAYGAILKSQAATAAKAEKAAAKTKKKRKQLPGHASPSKVLDVLERVEAAETKPDQIGPSPDPGFPGFGDPGEEIGEETAGASVDAPDDLPVIEGDDTAQLELEGIDV